MPVSVNTNKSIILANSYVLSAGNIQYMLANSIAVAQLTASNKITFYASNLRMDVGATRIVYQLIEFY